MWSLLNFNFLATTLQVLKISLFIFAGIWKMSGGLDVLALKEDDVSKLLAAGCHQGSTNDDYQMSQYIFRRKNDGNNYFNW